jgi:hypothetical protein
LGNVVLEGAVYQTRNRHDYGQLCKFRDKVVSTQWEDLHGLNGSREFYTHEDVDD